MNITIFGAFKDAIIRDRFQIGEFKRGTVVGSQFVALHFLDAIVDVGTATDIGKAPDAETTTADILLYVKPDQLPTIYSRELSAHCMIHDTLEDAYYAIVKANWGRNQESNELEHVELLLKETEVVV